MQKRLTEATKFIESRSKIRPQIGIVLGSGLGRYVDRIDIDQAIPYGEIPNFVPTSVEGHVGRLVLGTIRSQKDPKAAPLPVVVLQGRLHLYEGNTMEQVVFPVRTICKLGIGTVILTNASGGLNPSFHESDLMLITDHINLMGDNPLKGSNLRDLGDQRFPDLTEAYDRRAQEIFRKAAKRIGVELREGVYVALAGGTYETPAEVRMLRTLGADAVGMLTVPESIAANHLGVKVATISCIANLAAGLTPNKLTHAEVVTNAGRAVSKLMSLIDEAIFELPGAST